MELDLVTILFLIAFGFLGAFVDAIVGGGGLITLPALISVGLSPSSAIATNKLSASMGNFISTLTFLRAGKTNLKFLLPILPFIFLFSMFGAWTVHFVPNEILRPLVIVMLIVVLIYTLIKKDWGQLEKSKGNSFIKNFIIICLLLIIGFYDGFFGPGTGSFFIFVLLLFGFDFLQASGNSKMLNFMSNVAALVMFLILGAVNFIYGIIMGVAMIAGSFVGAKFALKRGTKFLRYFFIFMTTILIIKNVYDYYVSM